MQFYWRIPPYNSSMVLNICRVLVRLYSKGFQCCRLQHTHSLRNTLRCGCWLAFPYVSPTSPHQHCLWFYRSWFDIFWLIKPHNRRGTSSLKEAERGVNRVYVHRMSAVTPKGMTLRVNLPHPLQGVDTKPHTNTSRSYRFFLQELQHVGTKIPSTTVHTTYCIWCHQFYLSCSILIVNHPCT